MIKKIVRIAAMLLAVLAVVVAGAIGYASIQVKHKLARTISQPPVDIADQVKIASVELGKHIVNVRNGCIDCHGADLSGKVVMSNPMMGTISGPNLTPAALGDWSDGEIARAIRFGLSRDGHPLVLMPSQDFQNLSKKDLAAVIAYLRSVPAVSKPDGGVHLGPLSKMMIAYNWVPTLVPALGPVRFDAKFVDEPPEAPDAKYGKYLVTASCEGCHRPDLSGGPIPGGAPDWAPAADLRASAIGSWTEADFIRTLKTGVDPMGKKIRAPMPIAMTRQLSEVELKAIWAYIKTVK